MTVTCKRRRCFLFSCLLRVLEL